jgi:hypothetical protein
MGGWTEAEAAEHVPDVAKHLAQGDLLAWGRVGAEDAEPTLLPASAWLQTEFVVNRENGKALTGCQPIFDIRIFPILRSPKATDYLHGLTLGEAVRKHVVGDCEIVPLGRRLMEKRRSNSTVFIEGQFPGETVNFHWPLDSTSESIAHAFVSSCFVDLDRPLPEPSELENKVAFALADRFKALVDHHARGEVIGRGTFAATGVEGPIGAGQWKRSDLSIDVENNALCEIRGHRPVALWTGIVLQRAGCDDSQRRTVPSSSQLAISQPEPARAILQSTVKAETECAVWLQGIIGANPKIRTRTNKSLLNEANSKWPGTLGERAFFRALAKAIDTKKAWAWKKGGRPKKPPHL